MNTPILDQNKTSNINRLLKAEEVATLLSISPAYAYRLMQTGEIRVVRLGRAVRVRPQDLEAYVEANLHHQTEYL